MFYSSLRVYSTFRIRYKSKKTSKDFVGRKEGTWFRNDRGLRTGNSQGSTKVVIPALAPSSTRCPTPTFHGERTSWLSVVFGQAMVGPLVLWGFWSKIGWIQSRFTLRDCGPGIPWEFPKPYPFRPSPHLTPPPFCHKYLTLSTRWIPDKDLIVIQRK